MKIIAARLTRLKCLPGLWAPYYDHPIASPLFEFPLCVVSAEVSA